VRADERADLSDTYRRRRDEPNPLLTTAVPPPFSRCAGLGAVHRQRQDQHHRAGQARRTATAAKPLCSELNHPNAG
jgi:hypothetical protein